MGLACFHTNHGKLWIELAQAEDCELPKKFIDSDAHIGVTAPGEAIRW